MFFIRFCNSTLICAFHKEKIECKNKGANPPHVPKKLPAKNFRKNQADNKKQPFLQKNVSQLFKNGRENIFILTICKSV